MKCHSCQEKECYGGKDCAGVKEDTLNGYQGEDLKIMEASAYVEGTFYLQKNRVEELIIFARKMNYSRLGVAFCLGLAEEAKILGEIMNHQGFDFFSVCCNTGGVEKENFQLTKIVEDRFEATCNPILQARLLNKKKSELNIILGLCIGHDMLFSRHSQAPVTTLVVKDRMLAHNPCGALYSNYLKKQFLK